MKRRFRATTRCRKITDIAFSSTVKASELKKIIVANSSQPMSPRLARKCESSATIADDWPGTSHSR